MIPLKKIEWNDVKDFDTFLQIMYEIAQRYSINSHIDSTRFENEQPKNAHSVRKKALAMSWHIASRFHNQNDNLAIATNHYMVN